MDFVCKLYGNTYAVHVTVALVGVATLNLALPAPLVFRASQVISPLTNGKNSLTLFHRQQQQQWKSDTYVSFLRRLSTQKREKNEYPPFVHALLNIYLFVSCSFISYMSIRIPMWCAYGYHMHTTWVSHAHHMDITCTSHVHHKGIACTLIFCNHLPLCQW